MKAYMPPMTEDDKALKKWGDAREGGKPQMSRDFERALAVFGADPDFWDRTVPHFRLMLDIMEEYLIMYGTGEQDGAPLGIGNI